MKNGTTTMKEKGIKIDSYKDNDKIENRPEAGKISCET